MYSNHALAPALARPLPAANDAPANYLSQSDWEYQLDIEPEPSREFLEKHLAKVPDNEADGRSARWIREQLAIN